jgi:adenylate cyclase class 2
MFEIEMKFRVESFDAFIAAVGSLGGTFGDEVVQSDRYFNHPGRDFGETDEALRVRTIGDHSKVTYKGPVQDRTVKLREEIEMSVGQGSADGEQFAKMLTALSFREVRTVTKSRRTAAVTHNGREFEMTLDRVDGLGEFVEVETLADEANKTAARDALRELTETLGLGESERRSYLQMLLEL